MVITVQVLGRHMLIGHLDPEDFASLHRTVPAISRIFGFYLLPSRRNIPLHIRPGDCWLWCLVFIKPKSKHLGKLDCFNLPEKEPVETLSLALSRGGVSLQKRKGVQSCSSVDNQFLFWGTKFDDKGPYYNGNPKKHHFFNLSYAVDFRLTIGRALRAEGLKYYFV